MKQELEVGSLWAPVLGMDQEMVWVGTYDELLSTDTFDSWAERESIDVWAVRGVFAMVVGIVEENDNSGKWVKVSFFLGERLFEEWSFSPKRWSEVFVRVA